MKVHIGPYRNWIGPYQIAEKILFWKDKHNDELVHALGKKLGDIDWLFKLCNWIDSKKKRTIKVRIDYHDTWSLDHTLAYIIHPALKKMRDNKCGAPYVDDEDVPDHLKKSAAPPTENEWDTDDNHFKRWDYVLDEMIFSFEMKNSEWEDDHRGDWDSRQEVEKRIDNGFRLFGKYYQSLWT
jgi:hypothetical protein